MENYDFNNKEIIRSDELGHVFRVKNNKDGKYYTVTQYYLKNENEI